MSSSRPDGRWRLPWTRGRDAVLALPVADPPDGARGGVANAEVHSRVRDEVSRCRERLVARVRSLRELSEREILSCGRVLGAIVDSVREITSGADRARAESRARADELAERFKGEMRKDTLTQESLQSCLGLASGIQEAAAAIGGLTEHANLLAINARIEAARIGEQGRGFAVIAEHMRDLSNDIRAAAERVKTAVDSMRAGLPAVEELAASMQARNEALVEIVAAQASASEAQSRADAAGKVRLDEVLSLSNQALSHMQFQDPLAQELAAIERGLARAEARVRAILDGEALAEEAAEDAQAPGAAPAAGKVTLF